MLLNHSNHPSVHWPDNQKDAAIRQYTSIEDLPFPAIDPNGTREQIHQLADQYCQQIQARQPDAVHLMGELTYTYALVSRLKAAGIPCIASTTERLVTLNPDGTKNSQFLFVAFREY